MTNRLPDFIVIGAGKAGSTSLFSYLREDDRIFIPVEKELNYFSEEGRLDELRPAYSALFASATAEQLCGDVSPRYANPLQMGQAPLRIREIVPSARLIYLLRDPIQRAFSSYRFRHLWGFYEGDTPETFEDAIARHPGMVEVGAYMETLDRYFEHFAPEQILCVLTEDMSADANAVVAQVQRHIGLEPRRVVLGAPVIHLDSAERIRHGVADRLRATPAANWMLDRIPRPVRTAAYAAINRTPLAGRMAPGVDVPPMLETTRAMLRERYADSNRRLSEFLGRDLSHWCA